MIPVGDRSALVAAAAGAGVRAVYQPVVELATGSVVGHEALARWPDEPDLNPGDVFAAARRLGTLPELDNACLRAAFADSSDHHASLFVNVEPGVPLPDHLGPDDRPVVLELTERGLLDHPAQLLAQARSAREAGWRLAMDDVGAHPDSMALLDLLRPDVVKLDLQLIQRIPAGDRARTLAAVMAYVERTGAVTLAEGIETPAHREQAIALGARYGQGWLLGRPQATPAQAGAELSLPSRLSVRTIPLVPSELLIELPAARVSTKRMLIGLSRHLEAQAENPADPPLVLATFQTAARLTSATLRRYERLAAASPHVAVYGSDMPRQPAAHVRGVAIAPGDPLMGEWTVVALGAQTAAALIARDLGDRVPDLERRFEFCVSYDRTVVTRVALCLLAHDS